MPPKSNAPATAAAAAAVVSSSIPLRRSSRRSVPTVQSTPGSSKASDSTRAAAPASVTKPPAKRRRIKSEPETAFPSAPPNSSAKGTLKSEPVTPAVNKQEPHSDEALDVKPTCSSKPRKSEPEVFPIRPSPYQPLSHGSHTDRRSQALFIGAHISSAGGIENAPLNALRIGGNAFSCFVRPKMQWASNPISPDSTELFKQRISQHDYLAVPSSDNQTASNGVVVPHGCYLVNLANPDAEKREKSFHAFIDDLNRCEQLGIKLFNFHPGSMTAASALNQDPANAVPLSSSKKHHVREAKSEACKLVASYINRAHSLTSSVIILIENMAGSKNDTILASSLSDLSIILSHVDDKARVGICIDTCHVFAAGYDLTTPAAYGDFVDEIESTVGWKTVKAMHLNDSKFPLGCHRDRHENISRGHMGLGAFWSIVNDERWRGIPLILETPAIGNAVAAYKPKQRIDMMHKVWNYQINALYALRATKWGEWKQAEQWLESADALISEAEKLWRANKGHKGGEVKKAAPAKGKGKGKGKGKRKKKSAAAQHDHDHDEESDLSYDS